MNTTLQGIPVYDGVYCSSGADVRRARAKSAFENMRRTAEQNGYMSDAEIDSEIASARLERRGR